MSCPVCGEGKSIGQKTRLNVKARGEENDSIVICYNSGCELSQPTDPFVALGIMEGQPAIKMKMELTGRIVVDEVTGDKIYKRKRISVDLPPGTIMITPAEIHKAISEDPSQVEYLKPICAELTRRKINEAPFRPPLYVVVKKEWDERSEYWKNRFIIPFYGIMHNLTWYQGRTIVKGEDPKYRGCTQKADGIILYGLEKLRNPKAITLLEGPINSFFVANGIACGNSFISVEELDYLSKEFNVKRNQIIWIGDNFLIDTTARSNLFRALDLGMRIFTWKGIDVKDVNDYVIKTNDLTTFANIDYLLENSLCGMSAECALKIMGITRESVKAEKIERKKISSGASQPSNSMSTISQADKAKNIFEALTSKNRSTPI
jgi:hypothetical protein